MFQSMDKDHDKRISAGDIVKALKAFGVPHERAVVDAAVAPFDVDKNKTLSYGEFVRMITDRPLCQEVVADGGEDLFKEPAAPLASVDEAHADEIADVLILAMLKKDVSPADAFASVSRKHKGKIELGDLRLLAMQLELEIPRADLAALFARFDVDDDGLIDYISFLEMLNNKHALLVAKPKEARVPRPRSDLAAPLTAAEKRTLVQIVDAVESSGRKMHDVFHRWDKSGTGQVKWSEFKNGMRKLGVDVPKKTIIRLFSRYDRDADGAIRFNEFVRLVADHGSAEANPAYLADAGDSLRDAPAAAAQPVEDLSARAHDLKLQSLQESAGNMLNSSTSTSSAGDEDEDVLELNRLHTVAMDKIYRKSSDLASIFMSFDQQRDGFVSYEEIGRGLAGLGLALLPSQLADILAPFDQRQDGFLNLAEFRDFARNREPDLNVIAYGRRDRKRPMNAAERDFAAFLSAVRVKLRAHSDASLRKLFLRFDADKSGTVSVDEMFAIITEDLRPGVDVRRDQVQRLMRLYDADGDSAVNYDDFIHMISERASIA